MANELLSATWSQATRAWAVFRAQRNKICPYEKILANIISYDKMMEEMRNE